MIEISSQEQEFDMIMKIYDKALTETFHILTEIQKGLNEVYGYHVIEHMTKRLKTPDSIINKMKSKHYELNYKNLIEKINDIAGIRIICQLKSDIMLVKDIIKQIPGLEIIKEKDYIKHPKKSGYSGYHIIVVFPMEIENKKIFVKEEIQIRTMAMDFWSSNEHRLKYKTNNKLSFWDQMKLSFYGKMINNLDEKIVKLSKKQKVKKLIFN